MFTTNNKSLEKEFHGLTFKNPVGLAAGFDKNARYLHQLKNLGFGFVEIGTVTPKPQIGNPKPRIFRLPKDSGLINRLGFNNDGVDAVVERLKNRPKGLIVGGNIGKNKVTPNEEANSDYAICFEKLFPYVDYFTLNISSPNTPGLRELQGKDELEGLLKTIVELNNEKPSPKPVFLKIAPDVSNMQIEEIADIVNKSGIQGIICTNTTISREGLQTSDQTVEQIGNGGLSGKPVFERSTEVLKMIRPLLDDSITVIGVGGIMDPESGIEKLQQADLVQVYTGFIYYGPGLAKSICQRLKL